MGLRTWRCRSGSIDEVVRATTQHEAWETLRDRDVAEFGLLASAEPDENADPLLVRSSALMFAWGRDEDARALIDAAVEAGLPDTTEGDLEYARKHG